ncbi:MAG: hypothetical protein ISS92_04975 [Candidatus Omnitrophica bacterium]|nr:hypothetical protein [Candidatus Omnitrophota bacterium]
MVKRKIQNPYTELLDKFNRKEVQYVVIGMSGINYYASNAAETFSTQDYDIFVKPTIDNVRKAVLILKKLGYSVSTDEGEITSDCIKSITRYKKTIVAQDAYGVMFELVLTVSGYTFGQMKKNIRIFLSGKVPIKVGNLNDLLTSKKLAGRTKDKVFLKRYKRC